MRVLDLKRLLSRSFRPISFKKNREVNFPCPRCSHKSFSFNLQKKIGHCFRASCSWNPTLSDLEPFLRGSVSLSDELSQEGWCGETSEEKILLPGRSLVFLQNGEFFTSDKKVMEKVMERGVSPTDQYKFGLTVEPGRIFIPVFEKGELVNYVGRAFWWVALAGSLRYTYAPGAKTSNYLLNWDEASLWKNLTLVENSFNGIWLQKYNCTSNFGSNLSEEQINKILHSNCESVVLLWDEGAEEAAERNLEKLLELGIYGCSIRIKGQPDDYSEKEISELINDGHRAARTGQRVLEMENRPK